MLSHYLSYLSGILLLHYMCDHIYVLLSSTETFVYRSGLYQVNNCKCNVNVKAWARKKLLNAVDGKHTVEMVLDSISTI